MKTKKTSIQRSRKTFFARKRSRSGDRMKRSTKKVAVAVEVVKNYPFDARGLSKKDSLFVSNILKGMSKAEAMKLASEAIGVQITDGSASVAASSAMQKPAVESAIVSALAAAGINDELIAEKLKEGLDATAFTQTGQEHTDFKTRHSYIRTIMQVKGQIGADVSNQNNTLNYMSFKEEE